MLERIRELAKAAGISIAETERRAGLSAGTIKAWGKTMPSADKVLSVAECFGVTVEFLLTGES